MFKTKQNPTNIAKNIGLIIRTISNWDANKIVEFAKTITISQSKQSVNVRNHIIIKIKSFPSIWLESRPQENSF